MTVQQTQQLLTEAGQRYQFIPDEKPPLQIGVHGVAW
jgi:hypothetical protein